MSMDSRFFLDDSRSGELSALLALRHLGLASGGDVVRWAVDALNGDLDTPLLRILAGFSNEPNEFELDAPGENAGRVPPGTKRYASRFH